MIQAAFLDRDGTLVADPGFLRNPADVQLLPGAAGAVRRLNQAGCRVVVVSNQSGIARGLMREDDYQAVTRRLETLLAESGAVLDGSFHCPHYPPVSGPCECRKPGTLLFRTAAEQLGLALDRCVWIGDRVRDVLPARAFGGTGILVRTGWGGGPQETEEALAQGFRTASDLAGAVDLVLGPAAL